MNGQGQDTSDLKAEMREVKQLLSQAVRSGTLGSPARSGTESVAMHTPWSSPPTGAALGITCLEPELYGRVISKVGASCFLRNVAE